jgi:uncharacterized DUF497 family protein
MAIRRRQISANASSEALEAMIGRWIGSGERRSRRYFPVALYTEIPYRRHMNTPAQFEWDDVKAVANLSKHGIAFAEAMAVFLDPRRIEIRTVRAEDGEDRMKVVCRIQGRLFTIVFVMRGTICRIISARRSNPSEEKAYAHSHLYS